MKDLLAERIRVSLSATPVRRLIVCLGCGDHPNKNPRGALGNRVGQQMLENCAPSPSDIHNPDINRLHARNALGRARQRYHSHGREQFFRGAGDAGSIRRRGSTRNAQTWDSECVVDYMGVWCDRLLLGEHEHPSRCALLEPRGPFIMFGESLERVLLTHRNLKSSDLLFVFGSCHFPFGTVRLVSFGDDLLTFPSVGPSAYHHHSLGTVLQRLAGPPAAASALVVGLGDTHGPLVPFTAEENSVIDGRILPLTCFTNALWTVNPTKALEYLQSNPKDNLRLWRTMQSSMLSTRDTAVLRAYESGEPLDARMSQRQLAYLAETLLSRLPLRQDEG